MTSRILRQNKTRWSFGILGRVIVTGVLAAVGMFVLLFSGNDRARADSVQTAKTHGEIQKDAPQQAGEERAEITKEVVQAHREFRDARALLSRHFRSGKEIPRDVFKRLRTAIEKLQSLGEKGFGPIPNIQEIQEWQEWRKKHASGRAEAESWMEWRPVKPFFGGEPLSQITDLRTPIAAGRVCPGEFRQKLYAANSGRGTLIIPQVCAGLVPINPLSPKKYGHLLPMFGTGTQDIHESWIIVDAHNKYTFLKGVIEREIQIADSGSFWLKVKTRVFAWPPYSQRGAGYLNDLHATGRASQSLSVRLPVPPNPPCLWEGLGPCISIRGGGGGALWEIKVAPSKEFWPYDSFGWVDDASLGYGTYVGTYSEFPWNEINILIPMRGPGTVRVFDNFSWELKVDRAPQFPQGCIYLPYMQLEYSCLEWELYPRSVMIKGLDP